MTTKLTAFAAEWMTFATLVLIVTAAQAADWKLLGKNLPLEPGITGNIYYDKDSIVRPSASTVSVWERYELPNRDMKMWISFNCSKREITIKSAIIDGRNVYDAPWLNRSLGVEPQTSDEKLFSIVCK